jgi:hypothetical protein
MLPCGRAAVPPCRHACSYLLVAVRSIHSLFAIFGSVINETRLLNQVQ